ncbi:MAG: type II secretion system secretin GspD [Bacteroidota bacterium]
MMGRLVAAVLALALLACSPDRFTPSMPSASTIPPTPAVAAPQDAAQADPVPVAPALTRTEVLRGNQRFVGQPRPRGEAVTRQNGTVSLNFVNVDVRDVSKAILGDVLAVNHSVDPAVNGTVTVETAQPIREEEVLSTFETALKSAGLGLIERDRSYVVVPLADARRQPGLVGKQDTGYGSEAVPLHYANANALKKLFDPMVPENALHVDGQRNVMLVTGSSSERTSLRAMVEQFDVDWMAGMSFALITLQRADSRRMAEDLNQIINADNSPSAGLVRLIPLTRLNAIVVVSPQPQYIEDVQYWAEELDREGEASEKRLHIYRVQSGRASDLAGVLTSLFGTGTAMPTSATSTAGPRPAAPASPGMGAANPATTAAPAPAVIPIAAQRDAATSTGGQQLRLGESSQTIGVTSDDSNNAIVVYATSREYEVIERALRKLDVLPLQVLIEAMITEVSLNDSLRYGVEWYFKTGNSHFTLTSGKTNAPVQGLPGFSYLLSQGNGIQAVINALDDVTNVNVVSSPRLLVLNNQTATLQVGDQVPVATQSSVSTLTSTSSVVNSIEYRDTGVILKVTPRVNDSGLVLLDISQEISDVSTTTSSTLDSPTIQQRKVSSSVAVQDGQTVALGGLIRDNVRRNDSGVPLLKDVPILGNLFGSTNNSRARTELLVLLTPHVVRNAVDAQAITDELRRNISVIAPITKGKDTLR